MLTGRLAWNPTPPAPRPLALVAGGQKQRRTGRHVDPTAVEADELVPVVEADVADAGAIGLVVLHRNRVAELVPHAVERPLLGERVRPGPATIGAREGADVLHHPALLVERFFDEETVVGDGPRRFVLLGEQGRRAGREPDGRRGAERDHASHSRNVPTRSQALRPTMTTATAHAVAARTGEFTNTPIFRRWLVK